MRAIRSVVLSRLSLCAVRVLRGASLSFAALFAIGCGGGDGGTTQPPGQTGTLSVVATPSTVSLSASSSTVIALVIARGGGFTGAVSLSVSGLPAGVTGTFAAPTIDAAQSVAALTLTSGATLTATTSTVSITASGSGVSSATTTVQLTLSQSSFALTPTSTAITVASGQSATTSVAIARSTGFAGAVALSLDNPPAGITGTFATSPTTAVSASLTINVAATVAAGTYPLTIRGVAAGAADKTATINVTVTAGQPVGFTLNVDPLEFEMPAGQGWTANGIVSITRAAGFTGAVTISIGALAGAVGVIASPSPSVITATATASNVIALAIDGVAPGVYTGTVRASAAGFADQTAPVRVRISAPSTGSIAWKFCSASRVPKYFAVRDGASGAWRHIIPAGPAAATAATPTTFSFSIAQATGAVAMINLGEKTSNSPLIEGHDWQVYYMTTQEITDLAAQECTRYPDVTTRTATGTVTGYASFDAVIASVSQRAIANVGSTGQLSTTLSVTNVQPGAFDLMVTRSSFSGSTQSPIAVQGVTLQRGVNPASGGAVPAVNFTTGGFAPAVGALTFGNVNGESFFGTASFMTTTGLNAIFASSALLATPTRSWWGIPSDRVIAGDLHQYIASTGTTGSRRAIIMYARNVSARSLDFGPSVSVPSVTAGAAGTPQWIVRATGTLSADYVARASLYLRETFADPRTMTILATRGALGAGSAYDLAVPDLSAATGFTNFWNFHRGNAVAWTFTGGEGDAGGPMEANCMLSAICNVKAVDGAVYKSAQTSGTVTVP